MRKKLIPTELADRIAGGAFADLIAGLGGNDQLRGKAGNDTVGGDDGADQLRGNAGDDVLAGGRGIDTISTGAGSDTVVFDGTALGLGNGPDQLTDWNVAVDVFALDASDFGVEAPLSFQNVFAADLQEGANVIVLQNGDDDGNTATIFNARSAARLIGAEIETAGEGFFVYFNSFLNVNRLAWSSDLANGEAPLILLNAVLTTTGAEAIAELADYTASNFELF